MIKNKTHELKTWPKYFKAVQRGEKTFELRKNDRNFEVGHDLVLKEYDPVLNEYSGEQVSLTISYILHLGDYLKSNADYVILGIK